MAQQSDQDGTQIGVEVRLEFVQVAPTVSGYPDVQALVASISFTFAV